MQSADRGLVSVIIPTYNSAHTLPAAFASLLAQTYTHWEAIVVDDGSNDSTPKIIQALNDSRIRYFKFEKNLGRGAARQFALEQIRGEFMTMLDADDWLAPNKFSRQVAVLNQEPKMALVSCDLWMIGRDGSLIGIEKYGRPGRVDLIPPLRKPGYLRVPHAPSMMRSVVAKRYGYRKDFRIAEDFDFLLPLLLENSYGIIPEPLYAYAFEENKTLKRILFQLAHNRRTFLRLCGKYYFHGPLQVLGTFLKAAAYRALFALKNESLGTQRSFSAPDSEEQQAYQIAFRAINFATQKMSSLGEAKASGF